MNLGIRLLTWLRGELVGTDEFGNRYYRDRRQARRKEPGAWRRERRWVLYNGEAEATRVPPTWHGWLHHTVEEPPTVRPPVAPPWLKEHRPNQTGTPDAYLPPSHVLRGGQPVRATGDYEPWQPS